MVYLKSNSLITNLQIGFYKKTGSIDHLGMSYQFLKISDTKIHNTPESHLHLCQYVFCKSKNP